MHGDQSRSRGTPERLAGAGGGCRPTQVEADYGSGPPTTRRPRKRKKERRRRRKAKQQSQEDLITAADRIDQEIALLRRRLMGQSLSEFRGETPCPAHPSPTSARTFRKLHESGCFVIPNPWDVGSARYLQGLGFKALASTSSGFAWSVAHADNAVGVDMVLAHLKEICAATDVPVNADFEGGYADDPAGVAKTSRAAARPASRASRSRIRPATRTSRSTTFRSRSSA